MSNHNNNSGILLLLGTIVSLIGFSYLFSDKKNKVSINKNKKLDYKKLDFETDGFEIDAQNLQKDWENIGRDFQKAKEKFI